MKCQNCGKNEATFYYKSNINGRVMESHLCPQCAQKLGLMQNMRQPLMDSLWDDDFFARPFRMLEPLLGGFGSRQSGPGRRTGAAQPPPSAQRPGDPAASRRGNGELRGSRQAAGSAAVPAPGVMGRN